jgi:cysteine desulfurase family protein
MIYLDNAATSWPKPEVVPEAMAQALREGGNPGRGGHAPAMAAARTVAGARAAIAELLGAPEAERIVLGANATWALNLALKGLLGEGDQVVTGSMEHNAVVRPLRSLEKRGVTVARTRGSPSIGLDPDELVAALTPATRMVATAHASNVSGAISPIAEIGAICKDRGILFLVDAAQSAGSLPIDVVSMGIDLLAFPGHKGLLGPQGTGGLYIAPGLVLEPLVEGGTGTDSRSPEQPASCPERYESGTSNGPGIAGLGAAVRYLLEVGVAEAGRRESELCDRLIRGLLGIGGVAVYGPPPGAPRASVVSLSIRGLDPAEAAAILDQAYGIASRSGLHCAPWAHEAIGTLATGTLRLSPGFFTSAQEIDSCVEAVAAIARSADP